MSCNIELTLSIQIQDEFCTYMLLEYQEKEVMAGEKLAPFPYPLRIMHK